MRTERLAEESVREHFKKDSDQLIARTRAIHDLLRDRGRVSESEKPLVVSAALLALRHAPFRAGWSAIADEDLAAEMLVAVDKVVKKAIGGPRRELMMSAYDFVRTHPDLNRPRKLEARGHGRGTGKRNGRSKDNGNGNGPSSGASESPLRQLLGELEREVLPFAAAYPQIDLVGQFYAELLRYSGGEGQGLGIVLTPRHLTELFVQVAEVARHDTVLDACAGTGGFLISAMIEMDRQVDGEGAAGAKHAAAAAAKQALRERQLIGIEQRSDLFAMCVSNMILRGDGKSNIHRGDCFDAALQRRISQPRSDTGIARPTKGLLNPPYSLTGRHELDFVKAMLDMLAPGGTGVVVVPIKCALNNHPSRESLLAAHTLVAVMSLPSELFYPVATNTIPCALVLRAHAPHEQTDAPTWFGYWRDDGLVKVKNRGRVDVNGCWEAIKARWIGEYQARAELPGRCINRRVTATDEWCAEAYLETDPATITPGDFMRSVRDYALHRLSTAQAVPPSIAGLDTTAWKPFRYGDIFEIKKGYYNKKPPTTVDGHGIPFIGATDSANGVTSYITMDALKAYSRNGQIVAGESLDRKLFPGKCITVTNNGSVGEAFYQSQQFTCSHDVNPLYLKDKQVELSPALGLFLATIIRAEKYRWGYGRKWRPIRMPDSIIRLPATAAGKPDWKTMENWLNQLPLAKQIK